jgi:hypothetical protein
MSKVWQDFWTFAFLIAAYFYTIVFCLQLMRRPDLPDERKITAAIVLFIWVLLIPATLYMLGAFPELWRTLMLPFSP